MLVEEKRPKVETGIPLPSSATKYRRLALNELEQGQSIVMENITEPGLRSLVNKRNRDLWGGKRKFAISTLGEKTERRVRVWRIE